MSWVLCWALGAHTRCRCKCLALVAQTAPNRERRCGTHTVRIRVARSCMPVVCAEPGHGKSMVGNVAPGIPLMEMQHQA